MSTESLIRSGLEENEDVPAPQPKMGSLRAVWILSGLALVAILGGVTVGILWSGIVDGIVHNALVLSPTSLSYSLWKETPIPMYLELHLFNWTNPEDFENTTGNVPHFVEMGPYIFEEVDSKVNQVWNDENSTVTFQQKRVWHFVKELSCSQCTLSDNVTNINPVAVSVGYMMRYQIKIIKLLVNSVLRMTHEKLTVTKTVRELLFEGYDDKLLTWIGKFNKTLIPYDKFGWFYDRNESATYDGTFNILTGSSDMKELGILQEWNYSNRSKFYTGSCGNIGGSLGDLWPSLIGRTKVKLFAPDVCTPIDLALNGSMEFEGLTGNRFVANELTFDNGTLDPSLSCYCDNVDCQPRGVLNVSECKFGAPAFVSLPHFLYADETYRTEVSGMKPDPEKHRFSIVVEPSLGIPMDINARLQINLFVQPDKDLHLFQNVPKIFMPMFWFNQKAELTKTLANKVKIVKILPMLGHVTFYGIAGIGLLLAFIGIAVYVRRKRRAEDAQRLISSAPIS